LSPRVYWWVLQDEILTLAEVFRVLFSFVKQSEGRAAILLSSIKEALDIVTITTTLSAHIKIGRQPVCWLQFPDVS
jgi:hypothetical protein